VQQRGVIVEQHHDDRSTELDDVGGFRLDVDHSGSRRR
jgi:hypothetical protein